MRARPIRTEPAPYFPFSDGFRALAIFAVFLGHLSSTGPAVFHRLGLSTILVPFDGVAMLFTLSGFLLSGPFIKAYLETSPQFPSVGSYALARFLRIYPLYFVAIALIWGFDSVRHVPVTLRDALSHVLFLQNVSAATSQTVSGPLWTMAVDVQFYIALPFMFWIFFQSSRRSTLRRKVTTLSLGLVGICFASVVYRYVAIGRYDPTTLEDGIAIVRQLPGMLCVFAAGIGVRAVVQIINERQRIVFQNWAWALFIVAVALQALSIGLHLNRLHFVALTHTTRGHFVAIGWSLEDFVSGLACSIFLATVALSPNNIVSRLLSTRVLSFCASISYAFYLFHLPVLQALTLPSSVPSWKHFITTGAIALLMLVPLCYLLYRGIEKPFLKLKSRIRRADGAVVPDVSEMRHDRFQLGT